jgi:hypothetical protein
MAPPRAKWSGEGFGDEVVTAFELKEQPVAVRIPVE